MQDVSPNEAADLSLDSRAPQQLEPGLWRVPVPLPFATQYVNVYLLQGVDPAQGWLLVDCPLATSRAEAALRRGLEQARITPADICAIVITHAHPDHLGAAGYWQRLTGAPVALLALEAQIIAPLWEDLSNRAFLEAARTLSVHGMPADEAQSLVTRAVQLRRLLEAPAHPQVLAHGQRVRLAGSTFHVYWTPGHADGHLCLLREDGVLIAGDALLAEMRPTVGMYPWTRADPLAQQLRSLALLRDLPARLVLPGHGYVFANLQARADALSGLYSRQAVGIARLLAEASDGLSVHTLARALYPARWHAVDSRLVAMAEALAGLEHLRALGRAELVVDADGLVLYRWAHDGQRPTAEEPLPASA